MVPESVLNLTLKSASLGYWFTRRSVWVLGTSAALLLFPAFIEQQRQEIIAMQDMQTKQVRQAGCIVTRICLICLGGHTSMYLKFELVQLKSFLLSTSL